LGRPNTFFSLKDVLIENYYYNAGDDAIAGEKDAKLAFSTTMQPP
jgi:hypothetical protein